MKHCSPLADRFCTSPASKTILFATSPQQLSGSSLPFIPIIIKQINDTSSSQSISCDCAGTLQVFTVCCHLLDDIARGIDNQDRAGTSAAGASKHIYWQSSARLFPSTFPNYLGILLVWTVMSFQIQASPELVRRWNQWDLYLQSE